MKLGSMLTVYKAKEFRYIFAELALDNLSLILEIYREFDHRD